MIDGIYQSAVCYFFSYLVFFNGTFVNMNGLQINNREAYGVFTATAAIAACDFYVLINEYKWDWLFLLIVAISILLVFFWTGIYTQFTAAGFFYKAASQIYGSLPFWANTLLTVTVCLIPRFAAKAFKKMVHPRDIDLIREQVFQQHKFDNLRYEDEVDSKGITDEKSVGGVISLPQELEPGAPDTDTRSDNAQQANGDDQDWRVSLERLSGDRIRMSQDITELTRAQTLMNARASLDQQRSRENNTFS